MEKKSLAGIKVIDFTWVVAGPLITKCLADAGAEVIKIESSIRPDMMRNSNPKDGIRGLNRSGAFNQYDGGKLSLTLNVTTPQGQAIMKRLIARADIVIDNFSAGIMKRWGLDYEELKKIKPDIIMVTTNMQGHTGPQANSEGFGPILTALCGIDYITGWPDRTPPNLRMYSDYIAPIFVLSAILGALHYRRRTGRGQYTDISQYEACLQFMAPLILDYVVNGQVADRMGNRSAYAAPHDAYRCRGEDRWCAIAVFTDKEWQSFRKVIGNPAWTKEARFSTLLGRKENEDELDRLVTEWTVEHTAEEVMNLMQAAGVPAGVVETGEDLLMHDPQLKYQGVFPEIDHPEIGKSWGLSPAFTFSKTPCEVQRASLLGEHNDYILKEILGMSDDEVKGLIAEGVVK